MKTTTHTPGPWRVAKHDSLKDVRHIDAGPHGYERDTLAIVQGKRSESNARLIAAAPELLSALEALLEQADLGEVDDETRPIVEQARAAIAKANGGGL